jgi:diguanylate cyclase (GGDEF)-like protein
VNTGFRLALIHSYQFEIGPTTVVVGTCVKSIRGKTKIYVLTDEFVETSQLASFLNEAGYVAEPYKAISDIIESIKRLTPEIVLLSYKNFEAEKQIEITQITEQIRQFNKDQEILLVLPPVPLQAVESDRLMRMADDPNWESLPANIEIIKSCGNADTLQRLDLLSKFLFHKTQMENVKFIARDAMIQLVETKMKVLEYEGRIMELQREVPIAVFNLWHEHLVRYTNRTAALDYIIESIYEDLSSSTPVVFFKYSVEERALVLEREKGLKADLPKNIVFDLISEPAYVYKHLCLEPKKYSKLHFFVKNAFGVDQFEAYPVLVNDEIVGMFLVLADLSPHVLRNQISFKINCFALKYTSLQEIEYLNSAQKASTVLLENKKQFFLQLEREIERSRRVGIPTSLILIDIFDSGGSDSNIIERISLHFTKTSRINDLVCQVDNSKFALLLPHTSKLGAMVRATRLFDSIQKTLNLAGLARSVFVSIGVSEYPSLSGSAKELFNSSNQALVPELRSEKNNKIILATESPNFKADIIPFDYRKQMAS